MASIDKRQDRHGKIHYRARVRVRGHPPRSKSFTRLTDAKRWAQDTESSLHAGRALPSKTALNKTVAELIDRYIEQTLPNKRHNKNRIKTAALLRWWKKEIGDYSLANVTPAVITECKDTLLAGQTSRGTPRSPATVNRYLAAMSHCFTTAVKDYFWCEQSPFASVSRCAESKGRVRVLSRDERARLLDACRCSRNPHLYHVVVLAISTGARKSEILSLTWPQIDLENRRMTLNVTKNDEARAVPLASAAFNALRKLANAEIVHHKYVFPNQSGDAPASIKNAFDKAVARAALEDFRFHDLRHTAASYLAENGATLVELKHILGHKTLAMVNRYAHLTDNHTADLVERMNKRLFDL